MRGQLANATPENPDHAQHHPNRSQEQHDLQAALAAFGLLPPEQQDAQDADRELWLWPENRPAWDLWCSLQTQWRTGGMGVATGLDYTAVQATMQLLGIARQDRAELFALVRCMESAVLEEWDAQRKRD